jgi:hypothetical protein
MWINFDCKHWKRVVVRPFVGGVNAISGEPMVGDIRCLLKRLHSVTSRQDYVVLPQQKWLDGIATSPGVVKQFVATPILSTEQQEKRDMLRQEATSKSASASTKVLPRILESGSSIELQITDRDIVGGFQLEIIPEMDIDRMSFSKFRNTYYTKSALNGRPVTVPGTTGINVQIGKLNVLRTPSELSLQEGDTVHVKDVQSIRPSRPKLLKDLWEEATDSQRIDQSILLEADKTSRNVTWQARVRISCNKSQSIEPLELEVCVLRFSYEVS